MMSVLGPRTGTQTPVQPDAVGYCVSPRWLEVMPHLEARYGGITAVVPQLSSHLASLQRLSIDVAAFCDAEEQEAWTGSEELMLTRWPASRVAWICRPSLRRRFRLLLDGVDGVHIHGLWEAGSVVAAHAAHALRKPYVLSAHGMLEPWALANKGAKKKLYSTLVERANVDGAACLHALTSAEAEDYRRFGSTRPIAVIPNGVDIPGSPSSSAFLERFPELRDRRIILFLGRIHFKKGLDLLVRAWTMLIADHPDAVLVIAGPDSEDSQATAEANIAKSGVADRVLFTGMLQGELKWSALAAATAFVLPSYSEGFSVAVLEAMGMGLPVIVTTGCHLPEVQQYGAGWQIRPDAFELLAALQDVIGNSREANAEIGLRGRRLVQERFSWAAVSTQMAELYRWVAGGPRPSTFELQKVR